MAIAFVDCSWWVKRLSEAVVYLLSLQFGHRLKYSENLYIKLQRLLKELDSTMVAVLFSYWFLHEDICPKILYLNKKLRAIRFSGFQSLRNRIESRKIRYTPALCSHKITNRTLFSIYCELDTNAISSKRALIWNIVQFVCTVLECVLRLVRLSNCKSPLHYQWRIYDRTEGGMIRLQRYYVNTLLKLCNQWECSYNYSDFEHSSVRRIMRPTACTALTGNVQRAIIGAFTIELRLEVITRLIIICHHVDNLFELGDQRGRGH